MTLVHANRAESHRVSVCGHVRKLRLEAAELERFESGERGRSAPELSIGILLKLLAVGALATVFLYLISSSLIG
ncbi:MAG: hypothetical protein C0P74_008570 [Gammaproteobacteria bacterium]|nr:hypothetical protein [Gammaproteobacteria bacterium]